MGTNGGGGGGSSPSSPTEDINDIIFLCQQYAAVNEPGGIPTGEIPGGYNQETACKCEQFQNIQQNVPLGWEHLECLFQQARCEGSTTASVLASYVTAPNANPDLVSAFLNVSNCGTEGLDFKQFQGLYAKVMELKGVLGLNQGEIVYLLANPSITDQIIGYYDFLPETVDDDGTVNAILDYQMTVYSTEQEKMQAMANLLASEIDKVLVAEGIA